jgi:hypothetical protein
MRMTNGIPLKGGHFLPVWLFIYGTTLKAWNQGTWAGFGTVRVFWQEFTIEDAFGFHACSLEALAGV